jgi:hypothetical protein
MINRLPRRNRFDTHSKIRTNVYEKACQSRAEAGLTDGYRMVGRLSDDGFKLNTALSSMAPANFPRLDSQPTGSPTNS